MPQTIGCTCGHVVVEVPETPIVTAECHCNSCRAAGERLEQLPGAPVFRSPNRGTPYVLHRKDRVRFVRGAEWLRAFRLTPASPTRRVVAGCCNTPVFTEFQNGHWLSLYASLWPERSRPAMQMRTMTADLPDASVLDDSLPNNRHQSLGFFVRLLGAWIAMGFRVPRIDVKGDLTV